MTNTARTYYKHLYATDTKEHLIEMLLNEMELNNTRKRLDADQIWFSKYDELNKNCYLFSSALKEENKLLKEKLVQKEAEINGLIEDLEDANNQLEDIRTILGEV